MQLEVRRVDDAFMLEATNETGFKISSDAAPSIGGNNMGFRPMQLMLFSVASCSSIDILSILKKQKQDILDFRVTVSGEREKDVVPSLFTKIHLHYIFTGNLSEEKVKRAIDLSVNKYCSASKTLEKSGAMIKTSYEILNP